MCSVSCLLQSTLCVRFGVAMNVSQFPSQRLQQNVTRFPVLRRTRPALIKINEHKSIKYRSIQIEVLIFQGLDRVNERRVQLVHNDLKTKRIDSSCLFYIVVHQ